MPNLPVGLKRTWSWFKNVDVIGSIAEWSGIGKIIIGVIGSTSLGVWGLIDQLPGSVIASMVLVGFPAAIWAVQSLKRLRTDQPSEITFSSTAAPPAPVLEQTTNLSDFGPYLRGFSVRVADLARDDPYIRDRTFEDCRIYGPAIIYFDNCVVQHCGFEGSTESTFIVFQQNRQIVGVIAFKDCVFRRCHFSRIGILMGTATHEAFKRGISDPPAPPSS